MLKQFEFTPILGWSASRYDTFKSCQRRYYYTYYAKYDSQPIKLSDEHVDYGFYKKKELNPEKTFEKIAIEVLEKVENE